VVSGASTDGAVHGADGREVDEIGVVCQTHRVRQVVAHVLANHSLGALTLGLAVALLRVDASDEVNGRTVGAREMRGCRIGFDHLDGAGVLRLAHGYPFRELKCAINLHYTLNY
jgi:hypothetical protein